MAEKKPNETEKKQIELVVGQPVQITLQSMAGSTGYSWFLTKLSGGLALSDTTSVPTATVPGQIAPINQIFSFLAISKGTNEVEFSLIAPWRPSEVQDTEVYQVTIKEPEKTAAEEIESAMKGREFISASAVNVGAAGVIKYAAPMVCGCGPVMVPPYAAPVTQAQPLYAAPMTQAQPVYAAPMAQALPAARPVAYVPTDPCLDPRNSVLAANTMIAYAAPVGPSTMAVMDPCLDPRNSILAANTMIAYAAPVGPSTMAVMDPCLDPRNSVLAASTMIAYAAPVVAKDPCLDPRNSVLAANTMIAYAAPVGPSTVAAMRMNPTAAAGNILYAAPYTSYRYY